MLKNIFEGIISLLVIVAMIIAAGEFIGYWASRETAKAYVEACEDYNYVPYDIEADYCTKRVGFMEYETTIYTKQKLASIFVDGHSETMDTRTVIDIVLAAKED